jgi:hypothetical protein
MLARLAAQTLFEKPSMLSVNKVLLGLSLTSYCWRKRQQYEHVSREQVF